jgi:hypothetical protein
MRQRSSEEQDVGEGDFVDKERRSLKRGRREMDDGAW